MRLLRLMHRSLLYRKKLRRRRYLKQGMNYSSLISLTRKLSRLRILKPRSFKVFWPRFKQKKSLMPNRNLTILMTRRRMKTRMFNFKFQMTSLNPRKKSKRLRHPRKLLKARKKGTDRQWKVWLELPKENQLPPRKRNQFPKKSLNR
jgi:hypothetical protein